MGMLLDARYIERYKVDSRVYVRSQVGSPHACDCQVHAASGPGRTLVVRPDGDDKLVVR